MAHQARICLFTHLFPCNEQDYKGVFVRDLAVELSRRGHEVHVVAPMRLGAVREEIGDSVFIHRFSYWGWRRNPQLGRLKGTPLLLLGSLFLLGILKCVAIAVRHRIHLIHAYWVIPGGLIALIAARLTGVPVVATAAGSDLTIAPRHRLVRLLVTLTLAHLDRVVAVSAAMKRIGLELGLPENKCVVIHGPVGIDMPSSSQIQQRLAPEKKESQCLLYVGNLDPPKRADTIILAMSRIVNGTSDCHLVLIGTGSLRSSLEALADKLGLMGHVHFQGALERDQVFTMLTRADIFLHCSDQEGLGLAIIEAMGSGLPVVASRVGGVPELVQEGETGFMVGPDDAEGYAEKVLLLLNDEQLRKRLGSNGRRFAETHLNKRTILGQLESVYKEVLHWGENRRIK